MVGILTFSKEMKSLLFLNPWIAPTSFTSAFQILNFVHFSWSKVECRRSRFRLMQRREGVEHVARSEEFCKVGFPRVRDGFTSPPGVEVCILFPRRIVWMIMQRLCFAPINFVQIATHTRFPNFLGIPWNSLIKRPREQRGNLFNIYPIFLMDSIRKGRAQRWKFSIIILSISHFSHGFLKKRARAARKNVQCMSHFS